MTRYLVVGGNIAASFAGRMLVDAGAEVIRLDADPGRWRMVEETTGSPAARFLRALDAWLNTGQDSITFRTHAPIAKHLKRLISCVDVVLDDATPPQYEAFDLEQAIGVAAPCPWISMTPHGRGTDPPGGGSLSSSAYSGAAWAIGKPTAEPLSLPFFLPLLHAGLIGAIAGQAAALTMEPVHVDISAAEVLACYIDVNSTQFTWQRDGHRAARSGGMYPYTILPCKDGAVCLVGRSRADWARLLHALGSPPWSDVPWGADVELIATRYADAADERLTDLLANRTKDELLELAAEHGCAMAPVRGITDWIEDPEVRGGGVLCDIAVGDVLLTLPGREPAARPGRGSRVGERADAVLQSLGLAEDPMVYDLWRQP